MSVAADVLLIEDDPNDADLAIRVLDNVGSDRYPIKHVSDGSMAVEYLTDVSGEAKRPKLILLDLKLPKYDGFAILERIRNVSGWTKVPVVVLSSSSIESDVSRSYELGANAYVVKPIRYDAYRSVMKSIANFWLEVAS